MPKRGRVHQYWGRWKIPGLWMGKYEGVGMYHDILQSLKENA